MDKDYDKIAQSTGAVDYDAIAESVGGKPGVGVKAHVRKPRGMAGIAEVPIPIFGPGGLGLLPREQTAEALPVAAGTIAGSLSKPFVGGVPAAALAGSAGEALGQALMLERPDLGRISRAGAEQAAYEASGRGIAKGVGKLGGALAKSQMAKALSPAKQIVRNFPDVVADAIRQGASVNRWFGKGGARRAEQVRRQATGEVVGLLRKATAKGDLFDIEAIAQPAIEAVEKKAGPLLPEARAQLITTIQDRADELLLQSVMGAARRPSAQVTPMVADELRKAAARAARTTLNAESMGLPMTAIPDLDRMIAQGAAQAVRRIPGVAAAREAERTAIGVSRAVREAELRPAPPTVAVGVGPMHLGFGLPPGLASRIAPILAQLQNPMIQAALAQSGRATYPITAPWLQGMMGAY